MVSVCRGGPGCPPFLSFLLRGVAPARRGEEDCGVSAPHDEGRRSFAGFRPRTTRSFCFGKRTQNHWRPGGAPQRGCLCPGPCGVGCGTRCAQTVLAAKMEGTGPGHSPARRRQEAAFVSSVIPDSDRGSRVWGGRCLERRGTTRRSSPTGSWCLRVGAGLGARPSFFFLVRRKTLDSRVRGNDGKRGRGSSLLSSPA